MSYLTKICGITNVDDALMVAGAGADYLGILVDVECSPRSVDHTLGQQVVAVSPVPVIMLAFNHPIDQVLASVKLVHPEGVQLAGNENNEYVRELRARVNCELWKSIHISVSYDSGAVDRSQLIEDIGCLTSLGVDKIVLDSLVVTSNTVRKGGTGRCFDWSLARLVKKRLPGVSLFLAGGITPANITEALSQVSPDGVDLSSGVEEAVGKKSPARVKQLINNIRNFEALHN